MLSTAHKGPDSLAEHSLAAQGDSIQGGAVEGVPHGDSLVLAGDNTGQLYSHGVGLCTAGGKEHFVEVSGGKGCNLLCKVNSHLVCVSAWTERKLIQLLFNCSYHIRIAVSHLMHIVTMEIDVSAPLYILYPGPFCPFKSVHAWCGEGLFEEISLILIQNSLSLGANMLLLPPKPFRGNIHISLVLKGIVNLFHSYLRQKPVVSSPRIIRTFPVRTLSLIP